MQLRRTGLPKVDLQQVEIYDVDSAVYIEIWERVRTRTALVAKRDLQDVKIHYGDAIVIVRVSCSHQAHFYLRSRCPIQSDHAGVSQERRPAPLSIVPLHAPRVIAARQAAKRHSEVA